MLLLSWALVLANSNGYYFEVRCLLCRRGEMTLTVAVASTAPPIAPDIKEMPGVMTFFFSTSSTRGFEATICG